MLIQRVLTVALILPLFLAALFLLPQSIWGGVVLIVVAIGCAEWAKLATVLDARRYVFIGTVVASCAALATLPYAWLGQAVLVVAMIFWFAVAPAWLRRTQAVTPVALLLSGWIVLVSAWYSIYLLQETAARLLALLAVVWIADTAAYFAGRKFGRRKLAPTISPGKTWEGVIGAAVAVGVYYGLLWWVIAPAFLSERRVQDFVLVIAMAALSIEGDLFESWIKRRAGVKDSGTLLPGHGGVLDRIDGIVAALPLAALVSTLGQG